MIPLDPTLIPQMPAGPRHAPLAERHWMARMGSSSRQWTRGSGVSEGGSTVAEALRRQVRQKTLNGPWHFLVVRRSTARLSGSSARSQSMVVASLSTGPGPVQCETQSIPTTRPNTEFRVARASLDIEYANAGSWSGIIALWTSNCRLFGLAVPVEQQASTNFGLFLGPILS